MFPVRPRPVSYPVSYDEPVDKTLFVHNCALFFLKIGVLVLCSIKHHRINSN